MIKQICNSYTSLIAFLDECDFNTIVGTKYYYTPLYDNKGAADVDKIPYYNINTSGDSCLMVNGVQLFESFNPNTSPVGCIAAKLMHDGIAICVSAINDNTSIDRINFCCENNYTIEESKVVPKNNVMNNSLLVLTPESEYWYAEWRDEKKQTGENPDEFQWNTFNIQTENLSLGVEANSSVQLLQTFFGVSLVKMLLVDTQDVAKNNYVFVAGRITKPGCTFKLHGMDFIAFTDNSNYRCPAFKLQSPPLTQNDSMSTQVYEETKLYKVHDYCIYDDLLWKCIQEVNTPMAFDYNYWQQTTVLNEIINYEE